MKRIIALVTVLLLLFGFSACKNKEGTVEPSMYMNEQESKQQLIIGSFGISAEGRRIVGYKVVDGSHLEYIVVEYNKDTGEKKSEAVHCFYYNESYYERAKSQLSENAAATCDDDSLYIKMASKNVANTGEYDTDVTKVINAGYTQK